MWSDCIVREMEAADVEPIARLLAEREELPVARAREVVSCWIPQGPDRLVLVAEHEGRVQGYGKAERLAPEDDGGRGPSGWYLTGVIVRPAARRRGLGMLLTQERIRRLAARTGEVWYFANTRNAASIALHERIGFTLHSRDFRVPGVVFEGGSGALFRLTIDPAAHVEDQVSSIQ